MAYLLAGRYGPAAILDDQGKPQPALTVTVYQADGTTAAVLYTDRTKATTTSNVITTDAHGDLSFFANPANYVLGFSLGGTRSLAVTVDPDPDSPVWTPLPLSNGWINYGSNFAPAQYQRLASGLVVVQGLIAGGNTAVGTLLGTLPTGYWPAGKLVFNMITSPGNAVAHVQVNTDGSINLEAGGSGTWTSLTGISFPAER